MTNLDKYYPGMEALISQNGLSIQAQESHQLMTASDQSGEQTINRDAKTQGQVLFQSFTYTSNVSYHVCRRDKICSYLEEHART